MLLVEVVVVVQIVLVGPHVSLGAWNKDFVQSVGSGPCLLLGTPKWHVVAIILSVLQTALVMVVGFEAVTTVVLGDEGPVDNV